MQDKINVIDEKILKEAEEYIRGKFENELSDNCYFHNINHTMDVARNAEIIGQQGHLNEEELNTLRIAAMFHDVGYLEGHQDHEQRSAAEVSKFLKSVGINGAVIKQAERSILATRIPQSPTDEVSKALCDADLAHLGYEDYFENMDLLRKEWKASGRAVMSKQEFNHMSVEFFSQHQYHTDYGKKVLEARKEKNLARIRNIVNTQDDAAG